MGIPIWGQIKRGCSLGIIMLMAGQCMGQKAMTMPSFHVNFSDSSFLLTPTADKPQSKLWFMDACWWTILPDSLGPTLWQRTDTGWKEHPEISSSVKGIPGRADVWYEDRVATAVGVSDSSLCIFRMMPRDVADRNWDAEVLGYLKVPKQSPNVETATIAKDAAGIWWVAADVGGSAIYVWSSKDAIHWSDAILVGRGISSDDISCIAALKRSVIVAWSNQRTEAVYSREHINGWLVSDWSPINTIEAGNKTADDHINTARSANGTLWVVTKNSLDEVGYPQLVLRVRRSDGKWKNYPYLKLRPSIGPSRPVVVTTPDSGLILSGYTVYDHTNKGRHSTRITFGVIDTASSEILTRQKEIIIPDPSLNSMINNITVPKSAFPADGPWIILASDDKGYVYEADLRLFFGNNK